MEYKKLYNGINIPKVGFGTWQIGEGGDVIKVIENAFKSGYRFFDMAYSYGNEFFIGKALKNSNIDRASLFLQNKLWNDKLSKDDVVSACKRSLKMLKLDCFDSYLIHWPYRGENEDEVNYQRWLGMEAVYDEGLVKSIGVCNYSISDFENLKKYNVKYLPMINQIEFHPGINQKELIDYCENNNIVLQAWSPLGHGEILKNVKLETIAKKYNRTVAQICLKYNLEKGFIILPKSCNEKRMKENLNIFDYNLSVEDISLIDNL